MAVAFDANASAVVTGTGVTALNSSNLTVGVGSNRAVVAQLVLSLKTAASVTVNWDNAGTPQSQTLIVSANGTGTIARAELWGLVNPTSGAKQARAAWTGASDAYINCTSFAGVDQTGGTTSFPNSASGTGTNNAFTAFTKAIVSAVGNMTVACESQDVGSVSTPIQTQTFLSNALACDAAGSRASGAASVSHGWSTDTNTTHWVIVGTDILASGGGVTVALTNAAATFSAGTLTHTTDKALTNSSASFSAGTLIATPTLPLTNALGTFGAGSLTPSTAVPLTNALATFSAGTLTAASGDVTVALSGALATFSAGTLTHTTTVALTGALGTWSAGTITATPTFALTNAAATFAAGSMTPSSAVALTNALALWSAGNLGIQGDVTVALTGAVANWAAGTFTATASVANSSTPGRTIRKDWLKPKQQEERETEREPFTDAAAPRPDPDIAESKRIARAIALAESEVATTRARIAELNAQIEADGIRTLAEQARLERALLEAQQQETLLAVQQAVLEEEMEVIDIAYVALIAQQTQGL